MHTVIVTRSDEIRNSFIRLTPKATPFSALVVPGPPKSRVQLESTLVWGVPTCSTVLVALVANRLLQIRAMRLTPQPKPAPPLPTAAAASSAYQARYLRFMGLLRVRTRSLISRLQLLATSELQADAPVANLSVHPSAEVYQGAHVSQYTRHNAHCAYSSPAGAGRSRRVRREGNSWRRRDANWLFECPHRAGLLLSAALVRSDAWDFAKVQLADVGPQVFQWRRCSRRCSACCSS
jgi:hypothetical protein